MDKNYIAITFRVNGMSCVNCENKIERTLKNKKGIANAIVSYGKGTAIVTYDPALITAAEIEDIINQLGYQVVKQENRKNIMQAAETSFDGVQIVGVFVILLALYVIINRFGGFNIFNSFPEAKEGMGYGMLFLIGLLTSTHCIAMCGGINLSQCVPYSTAGNEKTSRLANMSPSILYNSGRVISYTIIGGLVGALGSVVSFSGTGKGIIALIAGVFMVIMGLNMLNLFPGLRRFNPRMPKIFAIKINEQKNSNRPLYVGLLNGLMPCGPLQAMQLYALSTGDPLKGALAMFLFSLGTVPLMFGLGALSTLLTKRFASRMMTVSAVLVVILGVFMFSNGMALAGYAVPFTAGSEKQIGSSSNGAAAEIVDGVQIVTTKLTSGGYEPIVVQAGIPVQWNMQAEAGDINGCNNRIVIPEYNIEKSLEPGDNIIEFIPEKSGVIPYSCWMGMIRSQISVVDDIEDPTQIPEVTDAPSNLPGCCGV
ncbi:MAG: sulfite exporter TauE/SafE family protein [Bacillota bacterium]